MVHQDLIPPKNLKEEWVAVWCACVDTINYSVAGSYLSCMEKTNLSWRQEHLIHIGTVDTDVLRWECCCRRVGSHAYGQLRADGALSVEMRAQAQQRDCKEVVWQVKEMTSSARPSAVGIEELGD